MAILDGTMLITMLFLVLDIPDLSLDFTPVHGMRLFEKNVEMAAIFLHLRLEMAKMRLNWPFWIVKC